ncbi:MFS transporter [Citricoccus sp. SGAir0253]|uniref:MFS transporter n=1 Tax=Citricoccus sp. SGAir0253 TaxID=2567881 RepID=UPI0010CCB371|nr:MFS transporter [Citricoccus sp. SGAir0253]QCU77098.1 MFS transporter [Citricoccus sp. SGAir0253]
MHQTPNTGSAGRPSTPRDTLNTKDLRRVLGSSMLGSIIEYYDFILYATAASIVFDKVFFSDLDPALALFASFGTLAAGYLARPLGGVVFGHFGDRVGRKQMLVVSMMMMGIATIAIGLLPTPEVLGWLSPVVLVMLRMVQGISVGGEWGGATLMALEHAPASRRGFAAAFANAGGPAGGLLATLVVSATSALTGDAFLEWGWRVPFLLSAVLIALGMVIRLKVAESPVFEKLATEAEQLEETRKTPLMEIITRHSRTVGLTLVASLGFYACQGILTSWGVAQAVNDGIDREWVLNWKGAAAVVTVAVSFLAARMSDRIGRRTVLTIGAVAGTVLAWPILAMLTSGDPWLFVVAILVGNGLVQGILAGPIGAFISELFPPRVRYTGASMSYQLASTLGAGFTPMIVTGLMIAGGLPLVGVFWIAVLVAGLVCIRIVPEGAEGMQGTHVDRARFKATKRIATRNVPRESVGAGHGPRTKA